MTCSRFVVVVVAVFAARHVVAEPAPVVERVDVQGARRVEPETILLQVGTKIGLPLDSAQLRADLRAIWKLGVFADVRAVTTPARSGGSSVTFEVEERPTIRKVVIAGNRELELGKIDDVLDLRRGTVVNVAAIRLNRDNIAELYRQHGFYLSTVDYDIEKVSNTEVDVKYTVGEHAKVRVRDIEFVGNRAISSDKLRDVMATRPPNALSFINDSGIYRRDTLDRDLAILAAHYMDAGFATVKIAEPALRLSRDKKFMHVTLTVDEGPRFTFGTIEFKGDLVGSLAHHVARTGARTGATFSRTRLERDRKALETHYQDLGYAYASIVPRMRVDMPARRFEIAWEIARGKRVYIERITIRGNSKTRDKVIRREMKIAEGELFSGSQIDLSKRRITALGFFESVTISTQRGSSDEFVVVNVEVRERRSGTLQFGAGFSSVESIIVQGQVTQQNFLGRGQSLAFQAQLSSLRRLFTFRFVEPYFLDTKWMFGSELYITSRGYGAFSRNATGGALTWGHPLSDNAHASLTYRLEDVSITSGSAGITSVGARSTPLSTIGTANLMRGGLTSSIRGTLTWDSRDNRMFPTDGWHATGFAEYAGKLTGSENQFVRWGGFLRHYQRIGGPFVLRLNGEVGVTTSLDGRGVPLSERYVLGGIFDIRGYQPRSLGPRLFTSNPGDVGQALEQLPLGGNLQLIGNAEIEFPLARKLGLSGVAFFDIGNSYNLEDRYCSRQTGSAVGSDACVGAAGMFTGLRKSVGFGVRWLSPIGPLRFEWGIPLDLKKGEKPAGLDFTIGTSF